VQWTRADRTTVPAPVSDRCGSRRRGTAPGSLSDYLRLAGKTALVLPQALEPALAWHAQRFDSHRAPEHVAVLVGLNGKSYERHCD